MRVISGAFSSIVNFTVTQFLCYAQELSIPNRIKTERETNVSIACTISLRLPKHHKQISRVIISPISSTTSPWTKAKIKRAVPSAFDLLCSFGLYNALKKREVHEFRKLNNFILNKMASTSKTVVKSSLSEISTDFESKADLISDDLVDLERMGRNSEDESDVYGIDNVSENSFHSVHIRMYNSQVMIEYKKVEYTMKKNNDFSLFDHLNH